VIQKDKTFSNVSHHPFPRLRCFTPTSSSPPLIKWHKRNGGSLWSVHRGFSAVALCTFPLLLYGLFPQPTVSFRKKICSSMGFPRSFCQEKCVIVWSPSWTAGETLHWCLEHLLPTFFSFLLSCSLLLSPTGIFSALS